MNTARRAYLYTVCLIAMQLTGWGAILWSRQLIDQGRTYSFAEWGGLELTATFVAFILVGVPVFAIHWWAARQLGGTNEQNAGLRKFYLYGNMTIWMATLVIVGLDLLRATLMVVTKLSDESGFKPWANLATLVLAGGLWGLHRAQSWRDARAVPQSGRGEDVRRFYRYLFAGAGMLMVYIGLGELTRRMLQILAESSYSDHWQELLVPAMSTLIVGIALVLGFWWPIQRQVHAGAKSEKSSGLRTLYLHLLILVFASAVLNSTTTIVSDLFRESLGVAGRGQSFLIRMSSPLGLLVSAGILGFYQTWLVFRDPEMSKGAGWRRAGRYFYFYLIATVALFMGLVGLIQVIAEVLRRVAGVMEFMSTSEWLGGLVATPAANVGVGFVVWLVAVSVSNWLTQREGTQVQERRSLWRRIHICLFGFFGVALVTFAMASLIRLVVRLVFGADAPDPFLAGVSNEIALLLTGGATWSVFTRLLTADESSWQKHLSTQQFQVAVIDGDTSALGQAIIRHLRTELPGATIVSPSLSNVASGTLSGAQVLIGSWEIAQTPGLDDLPGEKVLVPVSQGWSWAGVEPVDLEGLAQHAAKAARQIADGDPVRPEGRLPSYAVAALASSAFAPLLSLFVFLTLLGPAISEIFNEIIMQLGQ